MSKPVILLNAPPNAGKDTIAAALSYHLQLPHKEFKGKLFELAKSISGLSQDEWDSIYTRELKEKPCDKLWGMTPREFMIDISERMVKPVCGQEYFGEILGIETQHTGAVVSDSGFDDEAIALSRIVGRTNVYVIQFTREGCSFEGDSRNFLSDDLLPLMYQTTNDGTIDEIVKEILEWLELMGVE